MPNFLTFQTDAVTSMCKWSSESKGGQFQKVIE